MLEKTNMSCFFNAGFSVSGSNDVLVKTRENSGLNSKVYPPIQYKGSNSKEYWGKSLDVLDGQGLGNFSIKAPKLNPAQAQGSLYFGKGLRWWEKFDQPNMVEIESAEDLVLNLLNGGDRLVVVDFYSPGCGGCKALHPKICQLAESNPEATFLKVNYEQHKQMCHALHVHVLPFFRIYRGADGRVCSFSCTNATIKKFKDALAKHGTDRCSLGPARGLSEQELLALASMGQIRAGWGPESDWGREEEVKELVGKQCGVRKDENKVGERDMAMV